MRFYPVSIVVALLILSSKSSYADFKWTQPTAAELTMTSEPKAPGAPAILLLYEESADASTSESLFHLRIKVLSHGGLDAANIQLADPLIQGLEPEVVARIIHADGNVIPFTGSMQNSIVVNGGLLGRQRTIALSGVEVGSILEVFWHFGRTDKPLNFYKPVWLAQRNYWIREAHFSLKTPAGLASDDVRWVANLPPHVQPRRSGNLVTLDMTDIPAIPDEAFAPPLAVAVYNVQFFYYNQSNDEFWSLTGGDNDRRLQGILTQTKGLTNAVLALIQPTDTSEVKLHKLYNVVMSKQNTDYPHVRKPAGMQKGNGRFADDSEGLLKQDRGNSYSLTLLFVAMARAAGFSAYPMRVASRGLGVFNPDVHNWAQLDSTVAIVSVDGRDVFFDPGTPFCPFGHLAPWHSNVVGVSMEGKLVKFRYTSKETYNTAHFDRTVNLKLAPEGTVSGTVKLAWTGTQGLRIRLSALLDDQAAIEKELQVSTQASAPAGVQLQFVSFDGLSNGDAPLIANFTLTGSLGTPTRTRLLLPQQFFESTSKPLLEGSSRTLPINFPESFSERDLMTIELPDGYSVEAMPAPQSVALHKTDAFYKTAAQLAAAKNSDAGSPTAPTVILQRVFVMSRIDYKAEEYAELREYLDKVETADREPLVLRIPSSQNAAK